MMYCNVGVLKRAMYNPNHFRSPSMLVYYRDNILSPLHKAALIVPEIPENSLSPEILRMQDKEIVESFKAGV